VSNNEKDANSEPKRSKWGVILGIAGGIVVVLAGGIAALFIWPNTLTGAAVAAPASAATPAAGKGKAAGGGAPAPEKLVVFKFEPVIVDVMDARGDAHHLKVGLAAELADGASETDFKLLQPRAREAAITFLRSLTYEEITDAKRYAKLRKDLTRKVTAAVGEERVARMLVIDFVAQ
jgi:flagellar basal body-associated protein FliL